MKNNLLKCYIAIFYFCSIYVLVAQPGDTSNGDTLEGTDAPPAPIDDYVYVVLAIGIGYAFYKYRLIASSKRD